MSERKVFTNERWTMSVDYFCNVRNVELSTLNHMSAYDNST